MNQALMNNSPSDIFSNLYLIARLFKKDVYVQTILDKEFSRMD